MDMTMPGCLQRGWRTARSGRRMLDWPGRPLQRGSACSRGSHLGYLAIALLLRMLARTGLLAYAIYCFIAGALVLIVL